MTPIPKEALDDRLAFVGTAGSGKTYNAGSGVERLLSQKARVVIIDPLGVWWGLRLREDGATPSKFDVAIFGGAHGDLPLTEHAGALIGETAAGMSESCIVDLSQLGTKASERRFMLAFLTGLYRKTSGEPLHLIVDEADMFAPQRLMDKEGDAAKLLGMMETIVRRGRVKGFIPWLITQRPAVLSKDVLSQADGLVAFKLTSSQDRAAIGAWIEGQADQQEGKAILASLPSMERGQGVVWHPRLGLLETARFPAKVTFDSSRTPKRGETKRTATLKPLDLGALKDRLSKVEAETKANDPRALQAEIARLKREVAAKAPAVPAADPQAIATAERAGYERGHADGYAYAINGIIAESTAVIGAIDNARAAAAQIAEWAKRPALMPAARPAMPQLAATVRIMPKPERQAVPATAGISPTVRKILDVIHRANPMALSFDAAARRAAVSKLSSAYRSYLASALASGEVEQRDDGKLVSAPGFAAPAGPGINPVEEFASKLPPSFARMLREIAASGTALSREEVAERANVSPTSSGLGSGLNELLKLGLIEESDDYFQLHRDLVS